MKERYLNHRLHAGARPFGVVILALVLSLGLTGTPFAFECTNAGAGAVPPDDNGSSDRTACGLGTETIRR